MVHGPFILAGPAIFHFPPFCVLTGFGLAHSRRQNFLFLHHSILVDDPSEVGRHVGRLGGRRLSRLYTLHLSATCIVPSHVLSCPLFGSTSDINFCEFCDAIILCFTHFKAQKLYLNHGHFMIIYGGAGATLKPDPKELSCTKNRLPTVQIISDSIHCYVEKKNTFALIAAQCM